MPDLDAAWNKVPGRPQGRWRRFSAALPMRASLVAVASVWLLGCVWSFQEQSDFAASKGFAFPHLLPLVIDGFAVSMAGVSWAASLDARPAIPARLATVLAVGASSASNGVWAYLRTRHDLVTVVLGIAVPIAANLAFEVLLAELRRQVQRRRGLPPPVAVPYPRLIRLILAPWQTFRDWRALVLEITATERSIMPSAAPVRAHAEVTAHGPEPEPEQADPAPLAAAEPPEDIWQSSWISKTKAVTSGASNEYALAEDDSATPAPSRPAPAWSANDRDQLNTGPIRTSSADTSAPGASQPHPTHPSPAHPSLAARSATPPEAAQYSPAQPSPAQHSPTQPSPAARSATPPEAAQPSPTQPSPAPASPAQPSPAQHGPAPVSPAPVSATAPGAPWHSTPPPSAAPAAHAPARPAPPSATPSAPAPSAPTRPAAPSSPMPEPEPAAVRAPSGTTRPAPSEPTAPTSRPEATGSHPESTPGTSWTPAPPVDRENGRRAQRLSSTPPPDNEPRDEPITADERPSDGQASGAERGSGRPVDPRVERLARLLATSEEDELTGESVAKMLDVAPRTGRRLLGQARELVQKRALDEESDTELSVIGGR